MKPPPPILPALGCVTASANAVATAASTADPPLARTAAPASHAGLDVQTTRPSFEGTASSGAATSASGAGTSASTRARAGNRRLDRVIAEAYIRPPATARKPPRPEGVFLAPLGRRMQVWP